jgi:hypothetical protein
MSRNIQTVTKWLPSDVKGSEIIFQECKNLKRSSTNLLQRISALLENLKKKYNTKIHHNCIQNELNIQVDSKFYVMYGLYYNFLGTGRH